MYILIRHLSGNIRFSQIYNRPNQTTKQRYVISSLRCTPYALMAGFN